MSLQAVVVFVVDILVLAAADIAEHMFQPHMPFKLILIKETLLTEPTIRMHKDNIPKIINISSFHVLGELGLSVQFLLFKHTGFFVQAHVAQHSLVLLF